MGHDCAQSNEPEKRTHTRRLLAELAFLLRHLPELRDGSLPEHADLGAAIGLSEAELDTFRRLLTHRPLAEYQTGEEKVLAWDVPPGCAIGWRPSVLFPVFSYWQDFDESDGAPGPLTVFYPSNRWITDRFDTSFLKGCGRYPLVILLHGHCTGDEEHYRRWVRLPYDVARCGYVVVVPHQPNIAIPWSDIAVARAESVLDWMRGESQYRDHLMAPPGTAVIGHSNGALVGARLLGRIKASAYVSLSGAWRDGHIQSEPTLRSIDVPCLFTWGTGGLLDESLDGATKSFLWDPIKPPKHKLVFTDGTHFDYLSGELPCNRDGYGPCRLVPRLAANYTALFLSRYLPPPGAGIDDMIPATLMPPPVQRTDLQELLASWHLGGLELLSSYPECTITHEFQIPQLTLNPPSINFGSTKVGQTSARLLTIHNTTGHDLAVTFSAPTAPFDWLAHSIAIFNGQERWILVEFKPQAPGKTETTLTVTPFTASGPAITGTVEIQGTGVN